MPSTNFVETTQTDMSTTMRAVLIDWLVEVSIST
jgi:cyclin A